MTKHDVTTLEGIQKSCEMEPNSGCWIWMGGLNTPGHAQVKNPFTGKYCNLHRLSFVLSGGVIRDGEVVHHLCGVRCCVNPRHLEARTKWYHTVIDHENSAGGLNFRKTHCKRGHLFDESNIIPLEGGGRRCYQCELDRSRERYKNNKEEMNLLARTRYYPRVKAYKASRRDIINARQRVYNARHREKLCAEARERYHRNKLKNE